MGGFDELIERSGETARIESAVGAIRRGSGGQALLVAGSPGIGKTTLITEARRSAEDHGLVVLSARAEPLDRDVPLGLIRRLLWRSASDADPDRAFRGPAGPAFPLFESRDLPGTSPAIASSTGLTNSVHWLLVNLADIAPLAILVDDAHDADRASLAVLSHLASHVEQLDIVVIVGSRTTATPDPELGAFAEHARREGGLLEPATLTSDGVRGMLAGLLGADIDPGVSAACFAASEGNPELVRELASELRRVGESGPEAAAVLAPGAVSRVVTGRLRLLGDAEREVAEGIAILGGQSTGGRIGALLGTTASRVEDALARLEAADLTSSGLPPRLAHPTVASTVIEQIPPLRRSELHERAAALLADDGFGVEIQAAHLLNVEPAGSAERIATLVAAGKASRQGSPETAARFFERALAEPASGEVATDVLTRLGKAELDAGSERGIGRLHEALSRAGGTIERARIASALGRALEKRSRWREATEVLAAARLELDGEDAELQLEIEASELVAAWAGGARAGRDERLARIEASLGSGAAQAKSRALSTLTWMAATEATDASRVRALALEAAELGKGRGAADLIPMILVVGSLTAVDAQDEAEVTTLGLFDQTRDETDGGFAHALAGGMCVTHWWRRGQLRRAVALGDEIRDSVVPGFVPVSGPVGLALADAGRLDEAKALCAAADIASRRSQPGLGDELVRFAEARILAWEGKHGEAAAAFEEAGQIQLGHGIHGPNLIAWRSQAALCAMRAGDDDRALLLAEEELRLARAYGAAGSIGIALAARGVIEGGRHGEEMLVEAVELLGGAGLVLELGAAKLELGSLKRRTSRATEAREPLREALALAVEAGAAPLAERCRAELLVAGGRPRRDALSGPASLTASEVRIAELAASGRKNREIADELFLSLKTIEMHLRGAYRKLEISSRTELAAALSAPDGDGEILSATDGGRSG